ncbi:hypothetical protein ABT300_20070 [Streptomyces sp. NPDC001027]|uniref:hypothetical protein n=1 Tax=Streptomyces sp. NPDC001027 TaxID=3154771 RepID=UPI0033289915
MNLHLGDDVPGGLTPTGRAFVGTHGIRIDTDSIEDHRQRWLERDIPSAVIDRMAAFQRRWGGLVLPPGPQYEGGPRYFHPDVPEAAPSGGWSFAAGDQRCSVAYSFVIGPADEFGIDGDRWTPLHASVEGWVESLALAHRASLRAKHITKVVGDDVDSVALDDFEPVREVQGLADTWWRGADSLVAIYSGRAECLAFPAARTALIYSGLDEFGLRG